MLKLDFAKKSLMSWMSVAKEELNSSKTWRRAVQTMELSLSDMRNIIHGAGVGET